MVVLARPVEASHGDVRPVGAIDRRLEGLGVIARIVADLAGNFVDDSFNNPPHGPAGLGEDPGKLGQNAQRVGPHEGSVRQINGRHAGSVQCPTDLVHSAAKLVRPDRRVRAGA